MINMLPSQYKDTLKFAKKNTVLRKWIIACGFGTLGAILIIASGYLFIHQSMSSWQKQVDQATVQLKDQKLEDTQKRVSEISDSVRLVTQVLSKQIMFSKLLSQVAAAMPSGSSLQSLSISSVQGGIDLTAIARDYNAATQVQVNLSDPENKIFERADIVSVTCQGDDDQYPCTVTIRALFAKNNSFQYSAASGVNQ